MSNCANCQHTNPVGAKFCNNCGSRLDRSYASSSSSKGEQRTAERRQLTILFCDLVGSTPLSEKLDPEVYRQVITDYHQVAKTVIERQGGYVAQYLGDGLLVYFGYPEGLEDAPRAGVSAALQILEAIAEANQSWKAVGKTEVQVRIGIHTGLVVVDEHLALGETVNVAARLEGLAPVDQVVISPPTMKLVQGWFAVKSLGKQTLKGISEPMEVFQVLHATDAKTPLDIAKERGLSPLVGRDDELENLISCWHSAMQGKGLVVLLNGEAGIGKSRLVDTFEDRIQVGGDHRVVEVRASAYHKNSSFHPLIEPFEQAFLSIEPGDGTDQKLNKLQAFLRSIERDSAVSISLLAEYFNIISDAAPPLVMSPFAKRQRMIGELTQAVLGLADQKPLLFIFEDLHWSDASTLEWLGGLVDQLKGKPILLLCTTRPVFTPHWAEQPEVQRMDLHRLQSGEILKICLHVAKSKSLPPAIVQQIAVKTEGVPLFVEELTKMIVESGLVTEHKDHFAPAAPVDQLSIPSTLQDSLLARMDRLFSAKEVVSIGSVIGREFSFYMLLAMLDTSPENLRLALSQLLDAEIFYQSGVGKDESYQFKHALIRDAAYESLLMSRRQELHQRVADVLTDQFKESAEAHPEILAHHYTEAGKPMQAIPIWLSAGQRAHQKNAMSEAIAHLQKGISLLPHIEQDAERSALEVDFYMTLGGAYIVSHGFPHPKVKDAFNHAWRIARNSEASPKLALIMVGLIGYYFNNEDYESQGEINSHLIELSRHPEHGLWFDLFRNQLGEAAMIKGEFEKANAGYDRVLEIFDPSIPFPWELTPSGYIEVGAKAWKMICLYILGHYDESKALYDSHLSYADQHRDSMTLYHIYTFPALYCLESREWNKAEAIINDYLPIVREFGDPLFMLTAELYHSFALAFQGDRDAFQRAIVQVNTCLDVGFTAFASTLSTLLGELYYLMGEFESGLEWCDKMLDHVHGTGSHIHTAEWFRIKALLLRAIGGQDNTIEEYLWKAIKLARKQSAKTFELRAASDLANLMFDQGRGGQGRQILKEVYDWFNTQHSNKDLEAARVKLERMD